MCQSPTLASDDPPSRSGSGRLRTSNPGVRKGNCMAESLMMSPEAQSKPEVEPLASAAWKALTRAGFRVVFLFLILGYHRFVLQYFTMLVMPVLGRLPFVPDLLVPLS